MAGCDRRAPTLPPMSAGSGGTKNSCLGYHLSFCLSEIAFILEWKVLGFSI